MEEKLLFCDWETASELDLTEVGSPLYFAHSSTRGLMLSWALGDRKVRVWEPDLAPMPDELRAALLDAECLKLAWNVHHERQSFLKFCGLDIPLNQWFDIMILASYISLPRKLDKACKAMELPPAIAKMTEVGKLSIQTFCSPARMGGAVTLFGVEPTFYNSRENKPVEWSNFKDYCAGDSEVERYIYRHYVKHFPLPAEEYAYWQLDRLINERGMPANMDYARNALKMAQDSTDTLRARLIELTGLTNPNSDKKMLNWLRKNGYPYTSAGKNMVAKALKTAPLTENAQHVLRIRQEFKKISYHKLEALIQRVSADGRLRDMFAFLGASRTGRWAGQDVQFQNIARPNKNIEKQAELAMAFINTLDLPGAIAKFAPEYEVNGQKYKVPSAIDMVTSCLRGTFQASPGKQFVVSDLSAIENRVLGWVAGCDAILDVFKRGEDAYLAFAVKMYNLPYDQLVKIVDGKHEPRDADAKEKRQVAKPAVLGCGYGLGPGVKGLDINGNECRDPRLIVSYRIIWQCDECMGKFTANEDGSCPHVCEDENGNQLGDLKLTGLLGYADNMGVTLTPEQAWTSHRAFQEAYKEVPILWQNIERAVVRVLRTGQSEKLHFVEFSRVSMRNGQYVLVCKLPSSRCLHYTNARVESEEKVSKAGKPYTKHNIYYDGIGHGVGATTKKQGWAKVYTYGQKLVENIVQAVSRDILAFGMLLAHNLGMCIVGHVHDEIICEELRQDGILSDWKIYETVHGNHTTMGTRTSFGRQKGIAGLCTKKADNENLHSL